MNHKVFITRSEKAIKESEAMLQKSKEMLRRCGCGGELLEADWVCPHEGRSGVMVFCKECGNVVSMNDAKNT